MKSQTRTTKTKQDNEKAIDPFKNKADNENATFFHSTTERDNEHKYRIQKKRKLRKGLLLSCSFKNLP